MTITASVQAVIRALADSTASSSGGSGITGQGTSLALNAVITTNRILSKGNAYVAGSNVTATAGDITIAASNLSQIDADTESASSSGANAMGFQLAFNTIGWQATNLLFATLDALIGDPTIQTAAFGGPEPAETLAYATASSLNADGSVSLSAVSGASIFAVVGNSATSAPAALFGAGGMSVSGVLASSMVTSVVRAYVLDGDGVSAANNVPDPPSALHNRATA